MLNTVYIYHNIKYLLLISAIGKFSTYFDFSNTEHCFRNDEKIYELE